MRKHQHEHRRTTKNDNGTPPENATEATGLGNTLKTKANKMEAVDKQIQQVSVAMWKLSKYWKQWKQVNDGKYLSSMLSLKVSF